MPQPKQGAPDESSPSSLGDLKRIPWPYYLAAGLMGLFFGNAPQMVLPLRHDAFTASDGKVIEERIRTLELKVARLPPPELLSKIGVMSHDIDQVHEQLGELKDEMGHVRRLLERHMTKELRGQQG